MSRNPVHIKAIGIHRAMGIRRGEGFEIDNLAPGINLIFGPNGSGKSTICASIQELFWPGDLERPSLDGTFDRSDGEWRIEIDAGHVQGFHNGNPEGRPDFGSPEFRSRYRLGLTDLIQNSNVEFAKAVAGAIQGGYDLDAAADSLNFKSGTTRRHRERNDLKAQAAHVKQARRKQLQIQQEVRRLDEILERKDNAQAQQAELTRLQRALEYQESVSKAEELDRQLQEFPPVFEQLQGNERELLDDIESDLKQQCKHLSEEKDRIRQAETEVEAAGLPDSGLSQEVLGQLVAIRIELRRAEEEIRELKKNHLELQGRAEQARNLLGTNLREDQLSRLERIEMVDTKSLSRKAGPLRARRAVLDEWKNWLLRESDSDPALPDIERIQSGIQTLSHWLDSPDDTAANGKPTWITLLLAGLIFLVSIWMVGSSGWMWLIPAGLSLILLFRGWIQTRFFAPSDGSRKTHRNIYERSFLPLPDAWDPEAVHRKLADLIRMAGLRAVLDEKRRRLDALEMDEKDLAAAVQEFEKELKRFADRFGVTVPDDSEWLFLMVEKIRDWQSATIPISEVEHRLQAGEESRKRALDSANDTLKEQGSTQIRSSEELESSISDLSDRKHRFDAGRRAKTDAGKRIIEVVEPAISKLEARRQKVFTRLEIGEDQEYLIDEWLPRLPGYLKFKQQLSRLEGNREQDREKLSTHPELLDLEPSELEARIELAKDAGRILEDCNTEIGRIQEQVRKAKEGVELTEALEIWNQARQTLARAREQDLAAATGSMLQDWVRQEAIERSRPVVFKRADELFTRFSRGTLRLELGSGGKEPEFLARRGDRPAQSLDSLSGGERVQLLAAVRIAFLEYQESEMMPLMVDEVLATSDDTRAGALIDTLVDIAGQGRQVIYCTAQHDEIGKWKARLEKTALPWRVIELEQIRKEGVEPVTPLEHTEYQSEPVPKPGDLTYLEYGRVLKVPALDPEILDPGEIHLWYVCDDARNLYHVLNLGVSRWHELSSLIEYGGSELIENADSFLDSARAKAVCMNQAFDLWKVGRGRPVNRSVLLDSGCVSERFIKELSELSKQLNDDGHRLIHALESGQVNNWRTNKTDDLRDYLESEGFLPDRPPIDAEDFKTRLMGSSANDIASGRLKKDYIDWIIHLLPDVKP